MSKLNKLRQVAKQERPLNRQKENREDVLTSITNQGTSPAYERAMNTGIIREIALNDLQDAPKNLNPFPPLHDELFEELKASIETIGLQHTIVVAENANRTTYTILSGHNRVRAFKELNKKYPDKYLTIPAVVNAYGTLTINDMKSRVLDTNMVQRELTVSQKIQFARLKIDMLKQINPTSKTMELKQKAAEDLGWSVRKIERLLNANNLIDPFKNLLDQDKISFVSANKLGMFSTEIQNYIYEHAKDNLTNPKIAKLKYQMSKEQLIETLQDEMSMLKITKLPKAHKDTLIEVIESYARQNNLELDLK